MLWRDNLLRVLRPFLPSGAYPHLRSTDPRHALGLRGERLAARYLRRRGLKILGRNVRCGKEEIDLIALDDDTVAFVEVRTRMSDDPIPPEDTVNHGKQQRLKRAAAWYKARHGRREWSYRYDIVAVVLAPGARPVIRHHADAFR